MRIREVFLCILSTSAFMLAARTARGERQFADELALHWMLPYDPPCRLCHIQGTTGPGTLSTPFVMSLRAHGFDGSRASLVTSLDAVAADGTDSDGDGVSDHDELSADRDPNTAANVPLGPGGPNYGCATTPPGYDGNLGWLGLVAGACLIVSRGRRSGKLFTRAAGPRKFSRRGGGIEPHLLASPLQSPGVHDRCGCVPGLGPRRRSRDQRR